MICFRFDRTLAALLALCAVASAAAADSTGMYSVYSNPDSVVVDRAFDTTPAANLDEVVKQLTRAIDRLARYKVPKDPPNIYRVPHAELENYVCGTHCSIKAWYKPDDGIFLDDTLKPETNLFHRSILLHEMVHYFQDRSGEYGNMDECERWFHRELDAYTIQNRYLGVIGHPSRVAYVGDNCTNMTGKGKDPEQTQAFDGIRGRVNPDQH